MREQGAIISDGRQIASTLQCCHCGRHFVSRKGSGVVRGFCLSCGHVTCGASKCDICIPFEKQLGIIERNAMAISK